MLTNIGKIVKKAYEKGYAIPAFNVDNYEIMKAIVDEAESQNHPVILMFTRSAIKYYGLNNLIDVASNLAKNAKIEVATHLDHEHEIEVCKEAIDNGITSVMYDGSHFSIEENIKNTNIISDYIKKVKKDVSVEAEIGQISGVEDWKDVKEDVYTTPSDAIKFWNETKIDCLAISIGTAHGLYKSEPILNTELLNEINKQLKQPLVLHGGSGLTKAQIQECIKKGICKINFGTEIKICFAKAAIDFVNENQKCTDIRKIMEFSMMKLRELIKEKIEICKGK